MDTEDRRRNETIDIHYLDSGGTIFSFVTRLSVPIEARLYEPPEFAFSADGSKFAMTLYHGGVLIWDIPSNVLLRTFTELPGPSIGRWPQRRLQFSGGNLGKEILVFVEVRLMFTF